MPKSLSPEVHNHSSGRQARVGVEMTARAVHTHNCRVMAPCHLLQPRLPHNAGRTRAGPCGPQPPLGNHVWCPHQEGTQRAAPHPGPKGAPFPFQENPYLNNPLSGDSPPRFKPRDVTESPSAGTRRYIQPDADEHLGTEAKWFLACFSSGVLTTFSHPPPESAPVLGSLLRQVSLAPTGGHASDARGAFLQEQGLAGGRRKTRLTVEERQPRLG